MSLMFQPQCYSHYDPRFVDFSQVWFLTDINTGSQGQRSFHNAPLTIVFQPQNRKRMCCWAQRPHKCYIYIKLIFLFLLLTKSRGEWGSKGRDEQRKELLPIFSHLALKEPHFCHLMVNTTQRHALLNLADTKLLIAWKGKLEKF